MNDFTLKNYYLFEFRDAMQDIISTPRMAHIMRNSYLYTENLRVDASCIRFRSDRPHNSIYCDIMLARPPRISD